MLDLQRCHIPESRKPTPGHVLQGIHPTVQLWNAEQCGNHQPGLLGAPLVLQDCEHLLPCQCQPQGFTGTNVPLFAILPRSFS